MIGIRTELFPEIGTEAHIERRLNWMITGCRSLVRAEGRTRGGDPAAVPGGESPLAGESAGDAAGEYLWSINQSNSGAR